MKLPSDINGHELARKLVKLGYQITRQTGSHIRLTTSENGEHHITIPANNPLKIGTLTVFCLSRKWTFRPLELRECRWFPES
jgi:predicted RNA binding protein YcfA (HicA-like mRNA interferase family)